MQVSDKFRPGFVLFLLKYEIDIRPGTYPFKKLVSVL
jgi:hypothetical protein